MDHDQPHLKAQVWVFSPGSTGSSGSGGQEVLLLKTRPERGGGWQPITGSIEPGESPRDGAIRELFEETGLRVAPANLLDTGYEFEFESRWGGIARERVWACSVALSPQQKADICLDSSEHQGFCWTDLRQAEILLEYASAKKTLFLAEKCVGKKI